MLDLSEIAPPRRSPAIKTDFTPHDPLSRRIFQADRPHKVLPSSDVPFALREKFRILQKQNATLRQSLHLSSGLRQRFEVLFDASPLGLFTHDAEEHIVEANLTLANLLQMKRAQLVGQHIGKFIAPQDHAHFIQHLTRLRDNNENGSSTHCTVSLITSQQQRIRVRIKSTMQTASIIHGRISLLDRTSHPQCLAELAKSHAELRKEVKERELVEEQSRQHQEKLAHVARLNTMGEMAAGLAHEINQPLTAISSYVRSCLRLLEGNEQKRARVPSILEQACNQAQRAASIIQHLRDFVSKSATHRETTDPGNIVQLATTMMRTEFHTNNITLSIETLTSLPSIIADAIQIEQVVLNLLRNACDAMSSPDCPHNNRHLNIILDHPSETHIRISVSDTGPGISLDNMKKIPTPFFSTKTNGMGLGLAISRTIVEDHGGKLIHKPNPRGGVTFMFTLAITGKAITHH